MPSFIPEDVSPLGIVGAAVLPSVVVGGSVVGKSGAVVAVIHDCGQAMACAMLSSARALLFPVIKSTFSRPNSKDHWWQVL